MTDSARDGVGVYFDGETSRRQDVHVALGDALTIVAADGRTIARWPYDTLREVKIYSGEGLHLRREGGPELARLDLADADLATEIRRRAPNLAGHEARFERRIVWWSAAAVVSLAAFGLFGLPALVDRIAPLLPWSLDVRMGDALDGQIRMILPVRSGGFACGQSAAEREGGEALAALGKKLSDAAGLPVPIRLVAVRSDIPNAFALPGGVVYLFDGLIEKAASGDEIAGVLAHEIGHVAARDGARRALQAGGLALLLGFAIGDVIGGGAAVAAVRAVSEASYSRATESAADLYAVRLMERIGADPKALGALLARLTSGAAPNDGAFAYLASHPDTAARREAIDAAAGAAPKTPVMDAAAFTALRRICGARA